MQILFPPSQVQIQRCYPPACLAVSKGPASASRVGVFKHFGTVSDIVGLWFGAGAMFVFLALAILYPNDRLSGFAMATKTCRAAKLYQRPLNSMRSLSVLE